MDHAHLHVAVRFDSSWQRFAEFGCVYNPEWLKRTEGDTFSAGINPRPFPSPKTNPPRNSSSIRVFAGKPVRYVITPLPTRPLSLAGRPI